MLKLFFFLGVFFLLLGCTVDPRSTAVTAKAKPAYVSGNTSAAVVIPTIKAIPPKVSAIPAPVLSAVPTTIPALTPTAAPVQTPRPARRPEYDEDDD